MRTKLLLACSVIAIIGCMIFVNARAEDSAAKIDPVFETIKSDAYGMKGRKDYVHGFCDGIRAAAWSEATQHGWSIPIEGLVPPKITFPDKTTFTCRKGK